MRTAKQLGGGYPNGVSAEHPDGTVVNGTTSANATPVINEIYGDHLTNHYAILEKAGIEPNGIEDGETNGYQLLEAIQKLPNVLNDIEQTVSLVSSVFSVGLDISRLPNKYVFVAKVTGNYGAGPYTFKGSAASPVYNFTSSTGFSSGDEILVVIDTAGVRAFRLGYFASNTGKTLTKTNANIAGSDPNYYIDLSGDSVPQFPIAYSAYVNYSDGNGFVPAGGLQFDPDTKRLGGFAAPSVPQDIRISIL